MIFLHSLLSTNILEFRLHSDEEVNKMFVHLEFAASPTSLLGFNTVRLI